ncbi:PAS domain S-box protein [Pseudomonas duriflava]|uniref:PAS domain S-box protein n=1 Tax=Pseudomonas duriflava TaxID=459528 RepID=UPI0013153BBB|nr:PAS domain S-box protein [Pseudomonas duriflava]
MSPTPMLPTGWSESERLAELRRYGILDIPATPAFDDIVQLTAQICHAPIAVINLITEDREWFLAEKGLGVQEMPLHLSICAKAIQQPGLTVIADLRGDRRFASNPLVQTADGLRFYAGVPLVTPNGFPLGTLCVLDWQPRVLSAAQTQALEALGRQAMNLIELHKIRSAYHRSETISRQLFDSTSEQALLTLGLGGHILSANPAAMTALGWAPDELAGQPIDILFTAEDQAKGVPCQLQSLADRDGITQDEALFLRKDKHLLQANYTLRALLDSEGRRHGYLFSLKDVTAERARQRSAIQNEARYRALMDVSPQIVWFGDRHGFMEYTNRYWYTYTGLDPHDTDPDNWMRAVHPDHAERLQRTWRETLIRREPSRIEVPFRGVDGTYRWFEARVTPAFNAAGEIERWVGVALDIDDRRRAEEARLESEAFTRLLLDSLSEAFYSIDRTGHVTLCNNAFLQLLGFTDRDQVLGQPIHALIHPMHVDGSSSPAQDCPIYRTAQTGESFHIEQDWITRQDGSFLPVEYRSEPIWRDGELEGAICTFMDISERLRTHDRQRFLLELGDRLQGTLTLTDVAQTLGQSLGNVLRVQRIGYAWIDEAGILHKESSWTDGSVEPDLATYSLNDYGNGLLAELRQGSIVVVDDTIVDPRTHAYQDTLEQLAIRAMLLVPQHDKGVLKGMLYVHASTPHTWSVEDIALTREVADRIRIVAERTSAAEALRLAEQRINLAIDVATLGVWDYDINRDVISWDHRITEMTGISPEALLSTAELLFTIVHPDDRLTVQAAIKAAAEGDEDSETQLDFRVCGTHRAEPVWLSVRSRHFTEPDGTRRLIGIARDITQEKEHAYTLNAINLELTRQIEERTAAAERQAALNELSDALREASDSDEIGGVVAHILGRILNVSRVGYARMLEDGETVQITHDWSHNTTSFTGSYYLPDYGTYIDDLYRGEAVVINDVANDPRTCDHASAFHVLNVHAFIDVPLLEHGQLTAFLFVSHVQPRVWSEAEVGFLRDIADRVWAALERTRSDQALRQSEARFRLMADSAPALIWASDTEAQTIFANKRYETEYGLTYEQTLGDGWQRIIIKEDLERAVAEFQAAFTARRPYRDEMRVYDKQGQIRWLRCEGMPRYDTEGQFLGYIGCSVDITEARIATDALENMIAERTRELGESHARLLAEIYERERAEEALRQSQKMEAIGQLTGGIAHDFNNMLTGIVGALDLIRMRVISGRTNDLDRYINAATASADRASALTHRLLTFARRQTLDTRPVDLNQLISSLRDLFVRTVGEHVRIETHLHADLWPAFSDAHQLENALLNLVINARDAMPSGGQLRIETSNLTLDSESARRETLEPGDYVQVQVIDTGLGMSPEIAAKAFEPFFTTKPTGQGTGLGLAMIYGFVKQSGGHARIETCEGKGTTISLLLPRHHSPVCDEVPVEPNHAMPRAQAGQTVLVVEDEAAVRMIVLEVLNELGYTALEAGDAEQALPIIQSERRIDLLVSDVGLPGMNGRQLAEQARQLRPDLKVLFITGYAKNAETRKEFLGPNMDLLTKPFDIDALAVKIHDMIQAS